MLGSILYIETNKYKKAWLVKRKGNVLFIVEFTDKKKKSSICFFFLFSNFIWSNLAIDKLI